MFPLTARTSQTISKTLLPNSLRKALEDAGVRKNSVRFVVCHDENPTVRAYDTRYSGGTINRYGLYGSFLVTDGDSPLARSFVCGTHTRRRNRSACQRPLRPRCLRRLLRSSNGAFDLRSQHVTSGVLWHPQHAPQHASGHHRRLAGRTSRHAEATRSETTSTSRLQDATHSSYRRGQSDPLNGLHHHRP